jgi:hypothetical protein
MSSIRLGQLFACTAQGGLLVAELGDGRLLHIDDARSGLACGCTCPGCGRAMVAKKGHVQTHHFAHHAQQDGRTCISAGETALHKFAKRILDERLEIALPSMVVSEHGDREVVVGAERRTFDRAVLEARDGQIVPDVVLILRDRRLIVEFKVTHACDEQKIARIRAMDVGAIEIDLSAYRDETLAEIGDRILYEAPRFWLHNPRERQAREKLVLRLTERNAQKKKHVERLGAAYRHRLPSTEKGSGAFEVAARRDGLGGFINFPVDGAGCFTVALAEWQAAVVLTLIVGKAKPFRTRNGLSVLRKQGWLEQKFADIADEVASAIREAGISFKAPKQAVEEYLQELERRGVVHSGPTETWRLSETARRRVESVREQRERPVRRLAELRKLVTEMLSSLPENEAGSFAFDDWLNTKIPNRGHSAKDAVLHDEAKWQSFCLDLENIGTQIRFSPRDRLDLMGLPYQGDLNRALEKKRLEDDDRERAKQAKMAADQAARVANLRDAAVRLLGTEASVWLNTPNPRVGGKAPLEAAAGSHGECEEAVGALRTRRREIEALEKAHEKKERAVAELMAVAESRYYDVDRAVLWMRSGRRELGGKSPEAFTIDDVTRQRCIELLPAKRSRR